MKHTLRYLLLGALLISSAAAMADEMDTLQARLRQYITIGDITYSPRQSEMRSFLNSEAQRAQNFSNTMRHDTTYLWDDLNLLQGNRSYTPAHICSSYERLLIMARAWVYPGSRLYHSDKICQDIHYGLKLLYQNAYNEKTKKIGNWWEWRIGIPWHYANIVSILYEDMSEEEMQQFEKSTTYWVRGFVKGGDLTYANQASLCRNLLVIGILTKNPSDIRLAVQGAIPAFQSTASASDRMSAIRRQNKAISRQKAPGNLQSLSAKEGLWDDGTFIQHSAVPYIGTYGTEVIACAGYMARLLQGTSYSVPEEIRQSINVWVSKAFLPSIYRGESMLMYMGRGNAYDPYSGALQAAVGIMDAALLIPDSAEQAAALRAAASSLINDPHHSSPYAALYPLPVYKQQIDAAGQLSSEEGEQPFSLVQPAADRAIHQTSDWRFGLAMSSNRIGKYECFMRATGNQNTTGWYSGDGMTYLYLPNDPQQYYQYFLHVNPYRLPGTTVDLLPREETPSEQPLLGNPAEAVQEARAGGVMYSDSASAAMMQLVGGASDLRARKSWFMLGRQIVCLGTGISLSEPREVITTIDNRRFSPALSVQKEGKALTPLELNGETQAEDVRMAMLEGVAAYYFPDAVTLHANRSAEGNSELWLSHGEAPTTGEYAYVLLPGCSATEAQAYAQQPEVKILSNTAAVQAVELSGRLVAASFWGTGSLLTVDSLSMRLGESGEEQAVMLQIELSGPASLIAGTEGKQLVLAVSDPTWEQAEQTITLSGHYILSEANERVSISYPKNKPNYTVIRIKQKNQLGKTTQIRLSSPF